MKPPSDRVINSIAVMTRHSVLLKYFSFVISQLQNGGDLQRIKLFQ
jgi:hypothetical protein